MDQDPILQSRVYDSSPSDMNHPPQAVLEGNPLSSGWRTAPDTAFPAFLTLELDGLYEVSSVQFVAHELYVPQDVELFTASSSPAIEWVRLGVVKMGTAAQHNARERKTFKFSIKARLVKFQFSDYVNLKNSTGQISLTSVQVRGKRVIGQQQVQQPMITEQIQKKAQEWSKYFELIEQHKIRLDELIQDAVDCDDYINADRYLVAIKKLDGLKEALEQLQIRKLEAIKHQDFKAAQQIKQATTQICDLIEKDLNEQIMILNNEKKVAPVQQKPDLQQSVNQSQIQPPSQVSKSHIVDQINGVKAESVSKTQVAGRSGSPPINQIKQPTGAKKFDFNDPNMDPSQLKAKDMNFKMTEEEERRYQELINGKMKKQKQTDEEIQQQMEQVLKSRPAEFQLDLIEQEAANLIISNTKFPVKPFNFEEFSGILTSLWTKDDNKPAELTGKQMASDEYANLTKDGIPEMVIRLLFSKNLEHVREGVRFIDACIKNDQRRWAVAAMWAVKIVHQQPNQAMLAVCQWLYSRIYLALLNKYTDMKYTDKFTINLSFPNVSDQVCKQKDNSVVLCYFRLKYVHNIVFEDNKVEDYLNNLIPNKVEFYNDLLFLMRPLIERLTSPTKPAKVVATNVLATLSSFLCFSPKNFFNILISKAQIDKQVRNTDDNALERDQKYQMIVETRAVSAKSYIQNAPWLITETSVKVLLDFITWVLPYAQRTDLKNATIFLIKEIYQFEQVDGVKMVVTLLNKNLKSATLLKNITQELVELDKQQRVPPQVIYVEGNKNDKNDQPRIVSLKQTAEKQIDLTDFPPGVCQFCTHEVTKDLKEVEGKMWTHLLKDCSCCCICPSCHQVVEICYLPMHVCGDRECSGQKDYAYKLDLCEHCQLPFEESLLQQHEAQCQVSLKGDQLLCPLCGVILDGGEDALIHYSELKCQANPRTSQEFQDIIKQKMDKRGD
ncbi:Glycine- [Hexamita inflata]|uniref:Glutamate n=2 Tax=Hexamita inflata TaxID=28002 RepID=A0AA86NIJ8_9EUKA|nr:Glycine- [Hexamita inflata]